MKLSLTDLFEPVPLDDRAITKTFYENRPAGVGPDSPEELRLVRAAKAGANTASTRAAEHTVTIGGH